MCWILPLLAWMLVSAMPAADPSGIDGVWDWGHPDRSESRFRDLLGAAKGDLPRQAELWTQIARAQLLQGHPDLAQRSLDQAAALQPLAGPRARVRWDLESGRLARSRAHVPQAMEHFRAAATAATGHWDGLAVDALHMLAIVDPAHAVDWTGQALRISEVSADPVARGLYGPLCHNLAQTFQDQGRFQDALDWHRRDLAWRVRIHAPAAEQRTSGLGVAQAQRGLRQAADALATVTPLLGQARAAHPVDPWEVGCLEQEQGMDLLALGRARDALAALRAASTTLSPLFDAEDGAQRAALATALAQAQAQAHAQASTTK